MFSDAFEGTLELLHRSLSHNSEKCHRDCSNITATSSLIFHAVNNCVYTATNKGY